MGDFNTGKKLLFPSVWTTNFLYAYRPDAFVDETDNATFEPGPMPNNRDTPTDINDFTSPMPIHAHKIAMSKTAKQMGVTLVGKMQECKG